MRRTLAVLLVATLGASCNRGAFPGLSYATFEGVRLLGQWCAGGALPVRLGEVRLCADDPLPGDVAPGSVEFKVQGPAGALALEFRVQGAVVPLGNVILPTTPGQSGGKQVLCAILEVFSLTGLAGTGTFDIEVKATKTDNTVVTATQRITVTLECTPVVPGPSLIAYWSYAGGNSDIYTLRPDGSEVSLRTPGSNLIDERDPAISPDRARVAFVGNRDLPGDDYELYVVTLATGAIDRLSFEAGSGINLRTPCWAPDLTARIVVAVEPPGGGGIRVYDLDTPGAFAILTTNPEDRNPFWHPGGGSIVFERDGDLYRLDPALTQAQIPQLVLDRPEELRQPAYEHSAPFRLAFASGLGIQIWDGVNPPVAVTSDPFHDDPTWSPDGTRLLFGASDFGVGPVLYLVPSIGGALTPFGGSSCINPDWR